MGTVQRVQTSKSLFPTSPSTIFLQALYLLFQLKSPVRVMRVREGYGVDRCLHVHIDAVISDKGRKLAKAKTGCQMRMTMGGK